MEDKRSAETTPPTKHPEKPAKTPDEREAQDAPNFDRRTDEGQAIPGEDLSSANDE